MKSKWQQGEVRWDEPPWLSWRVRPCLSSFHPIRKSHEVVVIHPLLGPAPELRQSYQGSSDFIHSYRYASKRSNYLISHDEKKLFFSPTGGDNRWGGGVRGSSSAQLLMPCYPRVHSSRLAESQICAAQKLPAFLTFPCGCAPLIAVRAVPPPPPYTPHHALAWSCIAIPVYSISFRKKAHTSANIPFLLWTFSWTNLPTKKKKKEDIQPISTLKTRTL